MVEGHQERLDQHEERLDQHEARHDGHDAARAALTERVEEVAAGQATGWRQNLAATLLVLSGAAIMLIGVLVGAAGARG